MLFCIHLRPLQSCRVSKCLHVLCWHEISVQKRLISLKGFFDCAALCSLKRTLVDITFSQWSIQIAKWVQSWTSDFYWSLLCTWLRSQTETSNRIEKRQNLSEGDLRCNFRDLTLTSKTTDWGSQPDFKQQKYCRNKPVISSYNSVYIVCAVRIKHCRSRYCSEWPPLFQKNEHSHLLRRCLLGWAGLSPRGDQMTSNFSTHTGACSRLTMRDAMALSKRLRILQNRK